MFSPLIPPQNRSVNPPNLQNRKVSDRPGVLPSLLIPEADLCLHAPRHPPAVTPGVSDAYAVLQGRDGLPYVERAARGELAHCAPCDHRRRRRAASLQLTTAAAALARGCRDGDATVKLSQWTPKDEPKKFGWTKGEFMLVHKSSALIVAALVVPRLAARLLQRQPKLPEGSMIEKAAATGAHLFLYGAMVAMPGSGIAMGYFGGKGVPFFDYFHLKGIAEPTAEDKATAGLAFEKHKQFGQILTYVAPLHMGAPAVHALKGQNVLARMLPFGTP